MHQSMDTMSYSRMLLMVDLISKWVLLAFGGMEFIVGGLEVIVTKDSLMAMHFMTKMYFVHISYLTGIGYFLMAIIFTMQEMILA